jgi:hypothetical protein
VSKHYDELMQEGKEMIVRGLSDKRAQVMGILVTCLRVCIVGRSKGGVRFQGVDLILEQ